MRFIRTVALVIFLVTLLTSCFKDGEPIPTQCKVTGATYFNNGLVEDSSSYQYAGNKITGLKLSQKSYRFDYDSVYIVRKSLFTSDPAHPDQYDTILYNANKSIRQIVSYINLGSAYLPAERFDFSWSGTKLSSIDVYDLTTGTAVRADHYEYIQNGNNVVAVNHTDYSGTTPVSEMVTYSHDSNNNYFKSQNSQVFIIDPFFSHFDGLLLPFAYDANNITNVSAGTLSSIVSLNLDAANKNLQDIKVDGALLVHYQYQCQ